MNARELREVLKDVPDDYPIVLARDPEGNGYTELDGFSETERYYYQSDRNKIVDPDESDPLSEDGFYRSPEERAEIKATLPHCLVLWPGY